MQQEVQFSKVGKQLNISRLVDSSCSYSKRHILRFSYLVPFSKMPLKNII